MPNLREIETFNQGTMYRYGVFFTVQFEAIHCWPEAPERVDFLRNPHRHLFKLECRCKVNHNDRDIEFILMKREVQLMCDMVWAGKDIGRTSCEQIGEMILNKFPEIGGVTVSEDGENGANVWRRADP